MHGGHARRGWDHPRIRGEHLTRYLPKEADIGSSPHTRGAPKRAFKNARIVRIIPAYAGSTPSRRRAVRECWDHPRIRGEHSRPSVSRRTSWGSSPHTRGAPTVEVAAVQRSLDHPRIRGEHQLALMKPGDLVGSSPHTRGAPCLVDGVEGEQGIIPAYAGSTSARTGSRLTFPDHPRIRGEHSPASPMASSYRGSSPHTRGALCRWISTPWQKRIIPAYAGSTTCRKRPTFSRADHPRIRGEHAQYRNIVKWQNGSSPHTRGAPILSYNAPWTVGIIPAYAGSTFLMPSNPHVGWDHPRIRGEHPPGPATYCPCPGSSPHTRGAHLMLALRACDHGIIPAYAGSTFQAARCWRAASDHPRIRGEHPIRSLLLPGDRGSSPHTRGAHRILVPRICEIRIIPAYAGSTSPSCPVLRKALDHPRIRGEHIHPWNEVAVGEGSSPHTRGAPHDGAGVLVALRIIPAYAGSTNPHVGCFTFSGGSSPHTRGALDEARFHHVVGGIIPAYAGSTGPTHDRRRRAPDHPRIRGEHRPRGFRSAPGPGSSPHTRGAPQAPARIPHLVQDHPRIRGEHS